MRLLRWVWAQETDWRLDTACVTLAIAATLVLVSIVPGLRVVPMWLVPVIGSAVGFSIAIGATKGLRKARHTRE